MRFHKLLLSAAMAFGLVSASDAAMAVRDCASGLITGIVEDDIIIQGNACLIRDASVSGVIEASDSPDITVVSTQVGGRILIETSRVATVVASTARNIRVRRNDVAVVVANIANVNLVVNNNTFAGVKQNGAVVAIICQGNDELDARFNFAEGEERCPF